MRRFFKLFGVVFFVSFIFVSVLNGQKAKVVEIPADLHENVKTVLDKTMPLVFPRGDRMPLYIWVVTSRLTNLSDDEAEAVIKELDKRGIAMISNWNPKKKEETLAEGLRIGAIQQKLGFDVNINANQCMSWFFNGDEETFHIDKNGNKFADKSHREDRPLGCPFAMEHRYPVVKEQVEYFLRAYKEKGIKVNFIFADWEVDGPIEWNDGWDHSKRCVRCRENIKNINNFREFQKTLRIIRSDMQKVVLTDNVLSYFPDALVGNYAVYPHDGYKYWYDYFELQPKEGLPYKTDQRAKYREWYPEFELTGFNFSMPTVYTWYPTFGWYDFENTDYRWFYNMLLVSTNAGKHTPKDIPIISFFHWTTTAPPKEPDPKVIQFSQEKYKELLWHSLLRGHDAMFLWCPSREAAVEIVPIHQVYAASLQYKDFLDNGEPVSFDVPKKQGPVISGLKLGDKVLIRRTDFDDTMGPVKIEVDGKTLEIPRVEGKCQIFDL